MARPSKLTPEQWEEVHRRIMAGEVVRHVAKDFDISEAAIRKKFGANLKVSAQSSRVQTVARQLADAKGALAELPVRQQYVAESLADQLRSISKSYAATAEIATRTSHRLHALANAEVQRVDDTAPLSAESLEALKGIAVLTKIGNDALVPASNLLSANKPMIEKINSHETEPPPAPTVERLSLAEWKKAHGLA